MLFTNSKNKSNYQDLLKVIAIIAMIIDHCGIYVYVDINMLRVIGRIAMPIFCFFAGYNFHGKPRYKILIWGLALHIYTVILFKQFLVTNILIPIYLGQWYLYYFQDDLKHFFYRGYAHVIGLAVLWGVSWFLIDYGTLVFSIMILGYISKHEPLNLKLCSFITVFITFMHVITNFQNFSNNDIILVLVLLALTYILMISRDFAAAIPINLKWISRNVLYIYCIHLAIIEYIYYVKYF